MEFLSIVHEKSGDPTGNSLPRHEAIAQRAWCMSTNVFVLNSRGEVLCHQRSLQKERHPGAWSTHLGGHVGADETFELNAFKEVQEEAGVLVKAEHLIPWRTTKLAHSHLWIGEFVIHLDQDLDSFTPQIGEVERFEWLSPEQIMSRAADQSEVWMLGTHDFEVEYHCLRAALNTAHAMGRIVLPQDLLKWGPLVQQG
jgi:isopentenyldiphosphate isomerase